MAAEQQQIGAADTERAFVVESAGLQIDRLYHYQKFDIERLRLALFERKVRFANPAYFNDPWDCRPNFYIPNADETDLCAKYIKWFTDSIRKHAPQTDPEKLALVETRLRDERSFFEDTFYQFNAKFSPGFDKQFRVYCLSARPNSTLMWSHYSQDHRGICLEYSTNNKVFCAALRVHYKNDYPKLSLCDIDDKTNLLPLLVKEAAWSYEEEYRVIAQTRTPLTLVEDAIRTRRDCINLPWGALKSIIIGCMMPAQQVSEIRYLIGSIWPKRVTLKRAMRRPNCYGLYIEPI